MTDRAPAEIVLEPGDFYFGRGHVRVRTLLGSCVAVTLWHPHLHFGGMCHYVVPERQHGNAVVLEGKYGTEALLYLVQEAVRADTNPLDYVVKLFGGGNMFPGLSRADGADVGARNVAHGRRLLQLLGHDIAVEHVAGAGYRTLHFELWTGEVWLRFRPADEMTRDKGCLTNS